MPDAVRLLILGGGGHAKVIIDALRSSGERRPIGIVEADGTRTGELVLDVPIVGSDAMIPDLVRAGATHFAIGLAGTRDNALRARLHDRAVALGLAPQSVIHPASAVSRWATVGPGCQVLAGAVVNAAARLGAHVVVNTGAIVEHDCAIGDYVNLATGARLTGGVVVDDLAYIGAGAVVRQLIRVGRAAIVGAGAVVVKEVRADSIVAGVPAKEIET